MRDWGWVQGITGKTIGGSKEDRDPEGKEGRERERSGKKETEGLGRE